MFPYSLSFFSISTGNLGTFSSLAGVLQLVSLPFGSNSSQDLCRWHSQLTSFLKNLGLGQHWSILHYGLCFIKSSRTFFNVNGKKKIFAMSEEFQSISLMNFRSCWHVSASSQNWVREPGSTFSPETAKQQERVHEARVFRYQTSMVKAHHPRSRETNGWALDCFCLPAWVSRS